MANQIETPATENICHSAMHCDNGDNSWYCTCLVALAPVALALPCMLWHSLLLLLLAYDNDCVQLAMYAVASCCIHCYIQCTRKAVEAVSLYPPREGIDSSESMRTPSASCVKDSV
jgi:hypothetical protein